MLFYYLFNSHAQTPINKLKINEQNYLKRRSDKNCNLISALFAFHAVYKCSAANAEDNATRAHALS